MDLFISENNNKSNLRDMEDLINKLCKNNSNDKTHIISSFHISYFLFILNCGSKNNLNKKFDIQFYENLILLNREIKNQINSFISIIVNPKYEFLHNFESFAKTCNVNLIKNTQVNCMAYQNIYFDCVWENKFNKLLTTEKLFMKNDGRQTKVDMMFQTNSFKYYDNQKIQFVELPFLNGDFVFEILKNKTKTNCLREIDINEIRKQSSFVNISIYLPKICINCETDFEYLIKDEQFKNIVNENIKFSSLKQNVFFSLNENGDVESNKTDIETIFNCDSYFIFNVRQKSTNLIILTGSYDG